MATETIQWSIKDNSKENSFSCRNHSLSFMDLLIDKFIASKKQWEFWVFGCVCVCVCWGGGGGVRGALVILASSKGDS